MDLTATLLIVSILLRLSGLAGGQYWRMRSDFHPMCQSDSHCFFCKFGCGISSYVFDTKNVTLVSVGRRTITQGPCRNNFVL